MKRIFNWMFAAILTCGAMMTVASCSSDDDKPDKKCVRYEVKFNFANPAENAEFFDARYAWTSRGTVNGPIKAPAPSFSKSYTVKDNITFPTKESFYLHYAVKNGVQPQGQFKLNNTGSYTLITYNSLGDKLDEVVKPFGMDQTGGATANTLNMTARTAYVELNFTITANGKITTEDLSTDESKSKSGIQWAKKCANIDVSFSFENPDENDNYFEGKYTWWSGNEKRNPMPMTFNNTKTERSYSIDMTGMSFPRTEALFLHYTVKNSYDDTKAPSLTNSGTYTITTKDADGEELDSKTVDFGSVWSMSSFVSKQLLQNNADMQYIELIFNVSEFGVISLEDNSANPSGSQSGITW